VLGAVTACLLASAESAQALPSVGTLKVQGGFSGVPYMVEYDGVVGSEQLIVRGGLGTITFDDLGDGVIRVQSGDCTGSGTSTVTCWVSGPTGLTVAGGPGNDIINTRGWGGDTTLLGEDGADNLLAGGAADSLSGGAGKDVLEGADGPDHLTGGDAKDYLYGGPGTDYLDGREAILQAQDSLNCGDDSDFVYLTPPDYASQCETLL
jgi:Ca2+-binding RTX toxin-like protein